MKANLRLVYFLSILLTLSCASGQNTTSSQLDTIVGSQPPQQGCLLENGWNVCDYGEANIKDTYLHFKDLLGEPISGFDSRVQTFRFGRLAYNSGNVTDWKVEISNLGIQDMQARGQTPQPNSDPHPAVRDWMINQLDIGGDTVRTVGRIISSPVCDRDNTCRQWSDKQLFQFSRDDTVGSKVTRAPLGLLSLPQDQRRTTSPQLPIPVVAGLLLIVAVVAVIVVWLFSQKKGSGYKPRNVA